MVRAARGVHLATRPDSDARAGTQHPRRQLRATQQESDGPAGGDRLPRPGCGPGPGLGLRERSVGLEGGRGLCAAGKGEVRWVLPRFASQSPTVGGFLTRGGARHPKRDEA